MTRLLFFATIFLVSCFCFSQPNYLVSINTNPSKGNLFFQTGGSPVKPVSILDSSGTELFWADWGLKGWDFKVNKNNKLTYFDRSSKAWYVMDSLKNVENR